MEIKDSGTRREFESGAVRDVAEGKGRCDLLPLDCISQILNDDSILYLINDFCFEGDTHHLADAFSSFVQKHCGDKYTTILEVAKHYEEGAKKYAERNWQKGIPLHCYIDSAVRHYLKFLRGDVDEPHHRAFLWNILGAMWTTDNMPEMIDLPFINNINTSLGCKHREWFGDFNMHVCNKNGKECDNMATCKERTI
jgi:hypothetical protein